MAKQISVLDALAVLSNAGIELGEEHAEAIAEMTRATFLAHAVEIIGGNGENLPGKLVGDKGHKNATEWATNLLVLAESFANEFAGEVKSVQGGATRMVRKVGFDTPVGHLVIELKSE